MKRFLYFAVLSLALFCLFTICIGAADVDGVTYSLNQGASPPTASVTGIVQGTAVVKIPSTITVDGTEYRVTSVSSVTNKNVANTLKELYITSEYITELSGFGSSNYLEKIYITSPISNYASGCFLSCKAVKNVYIDFSNTTRIENNAFYFSGMAANVSNAVWDYGDEAINLYNVTYIGNYAFATSRIGGKYNGGKENTIIWPKKTTYMGQFCFTNCYIGGTVYINSTNVASNKQFSYNNSFETFIIGPDTTTIYNFNNGSDSGFVNSVNKVIILSKALVNGNSRTNLFDNWGAFDLYYYSDIQGVIDKQTTISEATHHIIAKHTLNYNNGCIFSLKAFSDSATLVNISEAHHAYNLKSGTIIEDCCPVGSVKAVPCDCGRTEKDKLNYGYLESASHNISETLSFANGFCEAGVLYTGCEQCDYESIAITSPMISSLGYSFDPNSTERTIISSGYIVDAELVELYNNINGTSLEIGVLFANAESVSDSAPTSLDDILHFSGYNGNAYYSIYDFKVRFPARADESYNKFAKAKFVASAYILDGDTYYFYQGLEDGASVLPSGFTTITLNHILGEEDVQEECEVHTVDIWTEDVPATCYSTGTKTGVCTVCGQTVIETTDITSHKESIVKGVAPTCIDTGIADEIVCSDCGIHISGGELLEPTGEHRFSEGSRSTIVLPTKYTTGLATNTCTVCSQVADEVLPYTATDEELSANSIVVNYTGGKYVNEVFTNLSPLGRAYATSFFQGTLGTNVIDRNYITFWNADTYVDGADYTADYIEIELPARYDIGVITLTVPNYYSYNLGNDCYVSYDIEYWDEASGAWICVGTVSDKDAMSSASTVQVSLTLDAPITAQKVRASVTHASRYAPAVVYELELFGKAQSFGYTVDNITNLTKVSVSGKYNDWAGGAECLTDNSLNSAWVTDARTGGEMSALMEFSDDTYVACVQVSIHTSDSRAFKIEVLENGEWVEVGRSSASSTVGGNVISCSNNISTININVEKTVSKIKFTITKEPIYWESEVYEIAIYSVSSATDDAVTTECTHTSLTNSTVVNATCVSTGYTLVKCNGCGVEFKTNAQDMLSHSFGEYSIVTPAISTTVGTKAASCANCDAICTVTYEESFEAPVVTPYRHNAPAAWAQTFDDGNYTETYDWVIPQLQKYGFRATAMLSVTFANAQISQWNERLESGVFDIGSHSFSHGNFYNSSVNYKNLLSDVVETQYWLRSSFIGQKVLTFAAPNGATSDGVAKYLTGMLVANRNGGQGYAFYNVISDLESGRSTWGNLNSYISKADQTEGDYVFTNSNGSAIFVKSENGGYSLDTSYANKNVNYVFDESAETFVNKGYSAGTYVYVEDEYRYDFYEVGSYNLDSSGNFVFVNDNSGEYKLVKATIGSYEGAIDTLISKGGFTVECLHSLGSGSIYSSYSSTISKFEYLTKRGVWAPSYQDLVLYLKEAQSAKVETLERTEKSVTVNVTDELDDYMFDYALTVKIDIADNWEAVTVTQNGVEIPLVDISEYRMSKNMSTVSCAIDNGYIYIDVIPDGGEVVITANATLDETGDGNGQIGVDIWDLLG